MRNYNCIMSKHTCSITKHFALLGLIKCLSIDLFCKLEVHSSLGRQLDENVNMIRSWHSKHTVIFLIYCVLYVRMLTLSAWILFSTMSFSVRVFPLIEVFLKNHYTFSMNHNMFISSKLLLFKCTQIDHYDKFIGECFFTNLAIVTLTSPQEREVNWFYKLSGNLIFNPCVFPRINVFLLMAVWSLHPWKDVALQVFKDMQSYFTWQWK